MQRYLRTTWVFWTASVAAEMEYRANFLIAALSSIGTLGGAIFGLSLFFQHGYKMGGWTWPQALIVVGIYTVLDGIQQTFLAPNRTRITEHVRNGTLDFVLLKPIDSQFWLSARNLSLWGLPNIILGVIIVISAGRMVDPPLTLAGYLRGLPMIAIAMAILYSIGYMLSTITVWLVKLWNITIAMQSLLEAGRYPVAAYPPAYRAVFTFLLPVAFMTTVPAEAMLGQASPAWMVGAMALAIGLFLLSRWFWRFALRYYTSASS